jgi:hypothetical protein
MALPGKTAGMAVQIRTLLWADLPAAFLTPQF